MRLSVNMPTSAQLNRIDNITQTLGKERVKRCWQQCCGNGDIQHMTKIQAQRIISQLDKSMPDYWRKR